MTADPAASNAVRLVAGCMTGTSLDGLDAALVAIHGHGTRMRAEVVRTMSRDLGKLAVPLRDFAEQCPMTSGAISRLARDFAELHLHVLGELIGHERIELVAVHGQTVFHAPPLSWQLINPAPIAHGLGVAVVHDLRAADLARGGQGAPITPIADWILFRSDQERRVVVNLGGFCNLTALPTADQGMGAIQGWDVCACNQILDFIARALFEVPFDRGGERALGAIADPHLVADLTARLAAQAVARRSLGTGDELAWWIDRHRADRPSAVIARSACAAIAATVCAAAGETDRMIVAGGGALNRALLAELRVRVGAPVETSDQHGVPLAYREAAGMAVIGALCRDRVPVTLPQVTGVAAPAPIAGCWTLP